MKKLLSILLATALMLSMVACGAPAAPKAEGTPAPDGAASPAADAGKFKIAVVTNTVSQNEEEYRSAEALVKKYGEDKIVHVTWPDNFMSEQEQMVSTVAKLASDPDIQALVLNQAVPGTNAAVDKLLETRDDMFIVFCQPQENPPDVAARADLILMLDEVSIGTSLPAQAQKMGAKTLVHYSFPRHMSQVLLSARREAMKEQCKKLNIEFVDATAPDPTGDLGVTGAQQFILDDVPKMIAKYGKDTAFFSTNCAMQIPLITAVVEQGGIYPLPCCPSPFHGYPSALGIEQGEINEGSIKYVIDETTKKLDEKGMLGRCSTWPVPVSMMSTTAGVEYAILWAKGEVAKEGLDMAALEKCMADYAGVSVKTSAYEENGKTFDNYRLISMDFLTYGEKK
ncbi:MAG: DUF3798 domain-containing protein [Oscillospiraceae bacterium]